MYGFIVKQLDVEKDIGKDNPKEIDIFVGTNRVRCINSALRRCEKLKSDNAKVFAYYDELPVTEVGDE